MTILAWRAIEREDPRAEEAQTAAVAPPPSGPRVYLPPASQLREMLRPAPPAPPVPTAAPTAPPAANRRDRMSIGARTTERAKELRLERDRDIPKVAQGDGRPEATGAPPQATVPPPAARTEAQVHMAPDALRLPPGMGQDPAPGRLTQPAPSIAGSLRRLEERLAEGKGLGLGSSGPKQIGPLQFDPQGADFTDWINHFTRQVYRNWIMPQAALMGFRGRVRIGFTVARDGRVLACDVLESSGTTSLDRAARNALLGSQFLPLPADFAPDTLTFEVVFYYNEGPATS